MKLFAAALVALAPFAPAAAATPAPLDQVAAHLRAVQSMTASFAQTDRNGKTLNGALTLKKPGKVRFQYAKGVPLLVVGDGRALTVIDYQVRKFQRWPIGDTPLAVLFDPTKDLGRMASVVPSGDPQRLYVKARDPKNPQYGTITLTFLRDAAAPAGLMLEGWSVVDAQSNRSSVRLWNQRFNVPVAASAFRWVDPTPRTGTK